jgi:hypothetical protein
MPNEPTLLKNAQGHYVPVDKIKDIDLQRNGLVLEIINNAVALRAQMLAFKNKTIADITAHIDLAADQYGVQLGGNKGNVQLTSFDGQYKILIAINDSLHFDERLSVAKALIDGCIHAWTKDSDSKVKALIEHAFQTDKEGNINISRVLGLLKLKIDDTNWLAAMDALRDSIQVQSSKSYLRLYQRNANDKFQQLSLDISGL